MKHLTGNSLNLAAGLVALEALRLEALLLLLLLLLLHRLLYHLLLLWSKLLWLGHELLLLLLRQHTIDFLLWYLSLMPGRLVEGLGFVFLDPRRLLWLLVRMQEVRLHVLLGLSLPTSLLRLIRHRLVAEGLPHSRLLRLVGLLLEGLLLLEAAAIGHAGGNVLQTALEGSDAAVHAVGQVLGRLGLGLLLPVNGLPGLLHPLLPLLLLLALHHPLLLLELLLLLLLLQGLHLHALLLLHLALHFGLLLL